MLGRGLLENWRARRKEARRRQKFEAAQARDRDASVAQSFERIYANAEWGAAPDGGRFWSGNGSHPEHSAAYEAYIVALIDANPWIGSIVDIGCGDFQVSARILDRADRALDYTGLDVVRPLIEHHNATHAGPSRRFICCDASSEPVPLGDLGIIRQILQHLSNAQAMAILGKAARSFKAAVIVESLPLEPRAPNLDIGHGVTTRVALGSGIYIDEPPFSLTPAAQFDKLHTPTELLRTSLVVFDPAVRVTTPHR